jgi:hypothetical protein
MYRTVLDQMLEMSHDAIRGSDFDIFICQGNGLDNNSTLLFEGHRSENITFPCIACYISY